MARLWVVLGVVLVVGVADIFLTVFNYTPRPPICRRLESHATYDRRLPIGHTASRSAR
jgi:hypothetical protein